MFLERDEMKFAILYTLKRYAAPINMPALSEVLTIDKEVMGYFDLANLLSELIEDKYVEMKYYRNDQCFFLSSKGKATNDFFFERVPKSIRSHIENAVGAMKFSEQTDPNAVTAEILPVAPYQYMASLKMLDAGTPLLELQVFAGSRADAERAALALKKNADELYKDIINKINTNGKER